DAGYPGRGTRKGPFQRKDLADVAASLPVLNGIAKPVDAVVGDELLDICGIRHDHPDAPTKEPFSTGERFIGLRKMPASVERECLDPRIRLHDGMKEDLILDAEARGECNPSLDPGLNDADTVFECGCKSQGLVEPCGLLSARAGHRVSIDKQLHSY